MLSAVIGTYLSAGAAKADGKLLSLSLESFTY